MNDTKPDPIFLNDLGIICALGRGKQAVLQAWLSGQSSQPTSASWLKTSIPAFVVTDTLPDIPPALQRFACRNNQLLLAAVEQLQPALQAMLDHYGRQRIGIVIGTSTSGIAEGEQAVAALRSSGQMPKDYHYKQQELGGSAEFLAGYLDIGGPAYTVSTTCSSSANALASARRLLQLGVCDAIIAGGSDALCRTTLEGFTALGALSNSRCNPFSNNRDGTVLGEGAALFLLSRDASDIALLGAGASADAYHISAPRPDGSGALAAMQAALQDAGLIPDDIDYINLHGTATEQNDAMESLAVADLFSHATACSSSKPATGHCLGAAGAIEAGLCWLLLSELNQAHHLPPHLWDGIADPDLPALNFAGLASHSAKRLQYCLSNSFSFGGNNVSLLIGQT